MIVVISHPDDAHAMRVVRCLEERGEPVLLLDLAQLPRRATLTVDYRHGPRPRIRYRTDDGQVHRLDQASAVWWRRPQAPDLSDVSDPQTHLFTANEWNEGLNGLWQLMLDARWMNDPNRDDAASRKARQLRVAAEVGLRTPRTLITSDPDEARSFISELAPLDVIYKTFSCTHAIWRETRLLQPADHAQLDTVRVAPVIFQEYVRAQADLRVTAVDGALFAASIAWTPRAGSIDFRRNVGEATITAEVLPADVQARLLALMERLGLTYGAIDLRRTPEGEYYFFEVNTAGEFLFIEDRTGLPIASAIADWLAGRPAIRSDAVPRASARTFAMSADTIAS
ncbi:alpha-L-glutamate ligase [Pseudoxanthomonas sp. PXM03]|jgi:glutathione synthase/RimK-type ligase-like ATP-grasp enzyme|uniref:MvdC/MvdD family ATP grasp protein n=1 Tax=unclassified Pseudoxanthomonas TaxID=2645906 RepID=UPI001781586A|nr:alpha-L-glutamate ligase [Pseudoxanthomonas sp. PXM03]MBD9436720.1 alpha-L-glutamate ligase [Pseudoxanthomonas sp. PXM03]